MLLACRFDVTQVQRLRGGIGHFGAFRHHFKRVEHGIVRSLLILFGFLTFAKTLRQVSRHLRRITLVEMLHKPFGHVGLAVVHRSFAEVHVEPVSEVFEQPNAFRIDAGGWQVDDFGDAVFAVGAGGFDVGEVHVGAYVHAERIGDAVHHFADAEASGARAEIEHTDAYDHAGFCCDSRFSDRLVPIPFDIFHIERNGVCMEFADGRSAFFRAIEIRLMFMFVLCAHKFRSNVWAGRRIFGISVDFTLWTPSDHDADISGISVTKLSIYRAYNGCAFTHQT